MVSSMLIADDGLFSDEVGKWVKEKHEYLLRYIDISRAARKKYLGKGKAGAAYFDLFCGAGRSLIRETGEYVDGSAVAAWKKSVEDGAPFSAIYVSDINQDSLFSCVDRLKKLNAPVIHYHGNAVEAAKQFVQDVNAYGLNMAFIDPYNLGSLDFQILTTFTALKRIDLLVHVSAMDLQRNLRINLSPDESAFDKFAPGWRDHVQLGGTQIAMRERIIQYWRQKVQALGVWPSVEQKLITGSNNQPLYWLVMISKSPLALDFWGKAANTEKQGSLF